MRRRRGPKGMEAGPVQHGGCGERWGERAHVFVQGQCACRDGMRRGVAGLLVMQ